MNEIVCESCDAHEPLYKCDHCNGKFCGKCIYRCVLNTAKDRYVVNDDGDYLICIDCWGNQ
jgi:hypothetical protein